LLDPTVADADGNSDNRDDTVSVFNGPAPEIEILNSSEAEMDRIATWLEAHSKAGTALGEIAVFVRSSGEIERAAKAVQRAKLEHRIIDETVSLNHKQVSICAMHLAKGLEFKCVVVMACDEDVLPLKARIESVGDESDLKEVYDTERHLLYVACTRARDHLIITAVAPGSEFLADMADWGAK
jgi:superfamily I DNA/RNA helicase